jgi:hypothetical protein
MVQSTQVIGLMVKQMEKESKCYLTELSLMDNGLMESSNQGSALTMMERFTKVNGKKVSLMVEVSNIGQMEEGMMGNGSWENHSV